MKTCMFNINNFRYHYKKFVCENLLFCECSCCFFYVKQEMKIVGKIIEIHCSKGVKTGFCGIRITALSSCYICLWCSRCSYSS